MMQTIKQAARTKPENWREEIRGTNHIIYTVWANTPSTAPYLLSSLILQSNGLLSSIWLPVAEFIEIHCRLDNNSNPFIHLKKTQNEQLFHCGEIPE